MANIAATAAARHTKRSIHVDCIRCLCPVASRRMSRITWRAQSAPRAGSWRERWASANARSSLLRSSSLSRVMVLYLLFEKQFAKRPPRPMRPHLHLGEAPPQQAGRFASGIALERDQREHQPVFGRQMVQRPLQQICRFASPGLFAKSVVRIRRQDALHPLLMLLRQGARRQFLLSNRSPELIARPDGDAREPGLERGSTRKTWQAAVRVDKDIMRDLRHTVGWHMPVHNSRHVLLIPGDQLRKQVDLPMQHPVDHLEIIGHLCLHPNEAGHLATACAPPASYLIRERNRTRQWTDPRRAVVSLQRSIGLQTF